MNQPTYQYKEPLIQRSQEHLTRFAHLSLNHAAQFGESKAT
jgi:hypothetical protein